MSPLMIVIAVFLTVFFGLMALYLLLSRSSHRLEDRLESARDDSGSETARRHDKGGGSSQATADRLFMVGPDAATDLRVRLARAGCRGPHSVLWYYFIRILLAGGLGVLGILTQRTLQIEGSVGVLLVLGSMAIGFVTPMLWVNDRVSRRRDAIRRAIPNVLDLIIVCVEAGLGLNAAIQRITREMKSTYPELAEELNILNQEIFIGKSRGEAFRNLARRTGIDELRSLATVLMQSDRMGTSIAEVLRVQADTLRTKRRQRALETAHKMPVKLVFPLVLFIFPEIMVVLLGPAGIQFYRTLVEMVK